MLLLLLLGVVVLLDALGLLRGRDGLKRRR
jgi:hypothetical protein